MTRRYPAYRDSGVEWLGEVPAHWSIIPPKRLMESRAGGTLIKGQCSDTPVDGLYAGFSASGQDVWLEAFDYDGEGIVLSAVGARCGKTFKADGQWGVVANTQCLFPLVGSDRDFLWYLTNLENWWEKGGSAQPFVLTSTTLARPWVFPPKQEQTTIAAFLDRETAKIDALVAEQRRLIDLLREKRQAVISHAVTRGLNPNAKLKPSGVEWLGDVPEGWEVVRLGALFSEATETGTADMPILSVSIHTGVSDDELADDEMDRKVTRSDDRTKYRAVKPGDLTYNMMRAWQGGFGAVQVVGMVSPAYVVARPVTPEKFLTEFVELLLRTPNAVVEMKRHSRGVTDFRLRLYWDEFKTLAVALPSRQEQSAILSEVTYQADRFGALSATAETAITLLQERRAALISAAVTGKIDVRDLVAQTEAA